MEQKEFSSENNENCEKLLDNYSTPSSAHLQSKSINEYLNSFDGSEGNTTKNNSTLKSNNSMTNVDSTVSRDNTSQEECKKINYDGKIENGGNNKIGTTKIAETKNLSENKNIHDIKDDAKKDELTIKSKSNEKNIFGTDYNSKEEIRKVIEKFNYCFDNCNKKIFSLFMDEDSFISEKDNDLEFLNKKTKRKDESLEENIININPKTQKKHKLSLKNFLKQKFPLLHTGLYKKLKKTENFRKSCYYAPMIFLKSYLKEKYQLNFDYLKCKNVLYESVRYMNISLNLKIYQLLLMELKEDERKQKVIDLLKKSKNINEEEKLKLFFLMTRTYEEFYNMYIHGSFYFSIEGKKINIIINDFITLEKKMKKENENLKNQNYDELFINKKIEILKKISKNMIEDIKNKKNIRKEKNKKVFCEPGVIDEFEIWRNKFKMILFVTKKD